MTRQMNQMKRKGVDKTVRMRQMEGGREIKIMIFEQPLNLV